MRGVPGDRSLPLGRRPRSGGATGDIPNSTGWPADPARAHRIAETLIADGLAVEVDGALRLP